ncbi:MAG: hypothetical protein PHT69_05095 [Bacteroidales bacterium]|nr:hypothetical protein [Bacteroidales bacterium]
MNRIFVSITLFFIIVSFQLSGQNSEALNCFTIDFYTDTLYTETLNADGQYNCFNINNAISSEGLESFFSGINNKDSVIKISINNFTGNTLPTNLNLFKNLTCISIGSCPNLKFNKLFRQLRQLNNLKYLELDDNESAEIHSSIKFLVYLESLTIRNYDLIEADKLLKNLIGLPRLKNLTIASTGRLELSPDAVMPKGLISLDLSDNWIGFIPEDISQISSLQNLILNDNNFRNADHIIPVIEKLSLHSLAVSCYNIRDSLYYVKAFPEVELNLNIYRDFQQSAAFRNIRKDEDRIPFISNYYASTIRPLIGDPQIERQSYTLEPQKSHNLLYTSGTTISIPDSAFTDREGHIIDKNITLYYREFRDVVDILANGLSMQYDSAGHPYFFTTGGMFEIFALSENQEVFLRPEAKILIDFSSIDTGTDFNLYSLNRNSGNWEFTSTLTNNIRIVDINTSAAYRLYNELLRADFDTLDFENRYADTTYARTTKIPIQFYTGKQKSGITYFKLKRAHKFVKNRDVKKMPTFLFELPDFSTFRELNTYRPYAWTYVGNLSKREFARTFITRKKWTDVRISYLQTENLFEIEIKSPHEFITFKAFPVRANFTTETTKYEKLYSRLDSRYNKALLKIQTKFDRNISKSIIKRQKQVWDRIYELMTPEEKAMSHEEWMAYARRRLSAERDSIDNAQFSIYNAMRSFEIGGFGIWNIDKINDIRNPVLVHPLFEDAFNNQIQYSTLYVVDKPNNSIYSYSAHEDTPVVIDGLSETAFFVTTENGMVAIVDKTTLKNTLSNFSTNNRYTFTAYEVDPMLLTTAELRRLLGFD